VYVVSVIRTFRVDSIRTLSDELGLAPGLLDDTPCVA
jgi:hypothetical protein